MKVLIIGAGGREHAIVRALTKHAAPDVEVFCAPGNAGIAQIAECVSIGPNDLQALADFASQKLIDLTFVGGESPLAAGIVDEFESRDLFIIVPTRDAARLESSKGFAKDFMTRHNIPTAAYRIADSVAEARAFLKGGEFGASDSAVVIKADGLAAGKGVIVASSHAEAEKAIDDLMVGNAVGADAARRVLIEEALRGPEVSLLLFSDGRDCVLMPAARDHKRVGENDTGPNTGGMGAITDEEILDSGMLNRIVTEIVEPTLEGARSEGFGFRGVLFIGLMLTEDGPRVLEYNVRFGDPEAQALLVRLQSPLIEILEAIGRERLGAVIPQWTAGSSACVVLASRGYPEHPETGARIEGLERAASREQVEIFHAGTSRAANGDWVTAGGRVLGVTARGETLAQALSHCYEAAADIYWDGMQYRRDIGRFAAR